MIDEETYWLNYQTIFLIIRHRLSLIFWYFKK